MSRQEQKESGLLNAAGVSYGGMIRARRKQKGLNQEELGALVRVGKNAVGACNLRSARNIAGGILRHGEEKDETNRNRTGGVRFPVQKTDRVPSQDSPAGNGCSSGNAAGVRTAEEKADPSFHE